MNANISIRKLALSLIASTCLALGTTSAQATLAVFDMPDDPTSSGTWNEDLTLGYRFTVDDSLTFNALAVFDVQTATVGFGGHTNAVGLNASHEVRVWDASTGTVLASAMVDPTDPNYLSSNSYGTWVYQTISEMTLNAGEYIVGAFYEGQSDSVMVQQSDVIENVSGVTYNYGQYLYSSTMNMPTYNYDPNESQYFGPTLLQVAVPAPLGVVFLGLGLVLMGLRRR